LLESIIDLTLLGLKGFQCLPGDQANPDDDADASSNIPVVGH